MASTGVAAAVYYVAYWRLHVPPYFWYYGIPSAALALPLAFAVSVGSSRLRAPLGVRRSRGLAVALTAAVLVPTLFAWGQQLEAHAPLAAAPVHSNWATPGQYERIGKALARRVPENATVASDGEFGTMLYYCDCDLLDQFNDRRILLPKLEQAKHSSWLMALNYLWLDPVDYPPVTQDFHLVYAQDPASDAGDWHVWSTTRGTGYIRLLPGPNPHDAGRGLAG